MATLEELAGLKNYGPLEARIEEGAKIVAAEISYKEDNVPPYSQLPDYDTAHAKRMLVAQGIVQNPNRNAVQLGYLIIGKNHEADQNSIINAPDTTILANIREVIDEFAELLAAQQGA